jgi:hypothetical protein
MSEMKWTPGPWEVDLEGRRHIAIRPKGQGFLLASLDRESFTYSGEHHAEADAALMAAAPELYATLEKASAAARRTAARIGDEHGIAARLWEGMADEFDAVLKNARGEK